jgi:2-polyprenyl-6-methoxyphenol hydroxylase-like FAD-dependent oxidoreductase
VQRPGAKNGIAFIGDAAISSDPIWAVGCGWALESSEWLVDASADRLRDGRDLDAGLRRYRRRHAFELTGHHVLDSNYSTGKPFNTVEKLLFAAGARDTALAQGLHTYVTRAHPAHDFLNPLTVARAMRVVASSRRPDRTPPVYQSKPSTNGSLQQPREVAAVGGGVT